jgi:hypothetical protein
MGCESPSPEPEPNPDDLIPFPIDSSLMRVSAITTYLDGQIYKTDSLSYVNDQLSTRMSYSYENGLLSDSTITVFDYEGEDIIQVQYEISADLQAPVFRTRSNYEMGQCVAIIREIYDNGSWLPSSTNEYSYEDGEFRQDVIYNMLDGAFIPVNWWNYSYADGRVVRVDSEGLNNGEIQPGKRSDFIYDGPYLSVVLDSVYNFFEEEFYLDGKTDFTEGPFGLLSREGSSYNADTGQFEPFNSSHYTYDEEGRLTVSVFAVANVSGSYSQT